MATTINFSQLAAGEIVTNQFSQASGVTFGAPTVKVQTDSKSPYSKSLVAARAGAGDFPTWVIKGTFHSPTHSRIGVIINRSLTLIVRDAANHQIGSMVMQKPPKATVGSYFYGEFATGQANIASFELLTSPSQFSLATMEFDTAGVKHGPDFRLLDNLTNFDIPTVAGKVGSIEFTMARLYGSKGPIALAISSFPAGLFTASPHPPPTTAGDGQKVTVKLVAGSKSIQEGDQILISGNPSPNTAGSGPQNLDYYYETPFTPPL